MTELENESIKYWVENGILFSEFKQETLMSLEKTIELIELRHQISNGENQYWCADFAKLKAYTKEGRDYADIHGQDFLYATAAIVNSHITMYLVNIFIKIKNPKIPFRAFKNKADAVEWLNELKNKISR
jgi:hypothetical protein